MKLVAPDAGSRRRFLGRVAAYAAGIAIGGCGGAIPNRNSTVWLEPAYGISGGLLTDRTDPTGMPLPGGSETSLSFLAPQGVVFSLGILFVSDVGYGRLFRVDRASGLMAAVPGLRMLPGSKIRAGLDGTLHVLDPLGGEIRRISLHGASLPAMHPRLPTNRYLDIAVEGGTGRVFAVDTVHKVVDRIEPGGRVAVDHLAVDSVGPIAVRDGTLFLGDQTCGCVREYREGKPVRNLSSGLVRLPIGLAVEGGEIYLLDGFDRTISRVHEGGLETLFPAQLNLVSPEQIFVSNGMMYVADSVSRSVAVFRIRRRHP